MTRELPPEIDEKTMAAYRKRHKSRGTEREMESRSEASA